MNERIRHGAAWAQDDVAKLRSMLAAGITIASIATELGRTQAAVEAKRNKLRRPVRQRSRSGASFFLS